VLAAATLCVVVDLPAQACKRAVASGVGEAAADFEHNSYGLSSRSYPAAAGFHVEIEPGRLSFRVFGAQ
jgi:hypothetical protein